MTANNSILIKNGRLIDPASGLDEITSLCISDGRITSIDKQTPPNFQATHTIDASGLIVCPGLVELSARLREPGAEQITTIASESIAAVKAGITSLCLPPDTDPVIDEPAVVELIQKRAQQHQGARVFTLGALTTGLHGKKLSEMAALKQAGCVGVSNALHPVQDSRVLRHAMEYAATHGLTLHVIPIDYALANNGCAHEGEVATLLGLQTIPVAAETVAIAQHLALIEEVGIKTHFGRLSSARAVEMITEAKLRGLPITADVAIHHLHLTEQDIAHFNDQAHVIPPLRSAADRDALIAGIKSGAIDAICSDHQPHEADAKLNPFSATEPGISGIDTLMGLSLSLIEKTDISLAQILKAISYCPAKILNLDVGEITIGAIADLCLYNPKQNWLVNENNLNSAGKNTPFMSKQLPGQIMHTLVNGQIINVQDKS